MMMLIGTKVDGSEFTKLHKQSTVHQSIDDEIEVGVQWLSRTGLFRKCHDDNGIVRSGLKDK